MQQRPGREPAVTSDSAYAHANLDGQPDGDGYSGCAYVHANLDGHAGGDASSGCACAHANLYGHADGDGYSGCANTRANLYGHADGDGYSGCAYANADFDAVANLGHAIAGCHRDAHDLPLRHLRPYRCGVDARQLRLPHA